MKVGPFFGSRIVKFFVADYTSTRRPVKVIFVEEFASRVEALEDERKEDRKVSLSYYINANLI